MSVVTTRTHTRGIFLPLQTAPTLGTVSEVSGVVRLLSVAALRHLLLEISQPLVDLAEIVTRRLRPRAEMHFCIRLRRSSGA